METSIAKVLELKEVLEEFSSCKLPIQVAYKISKLSTAVEQEFAWYSTELNKIISEYSEKDEDGKPVLLDNKLGIKIQSEFISAAEERVNELVGVVINLPEISFTIDELSSLELTVKQLNILFPFIKE